MAGTSEPTTRHADGPAQDATVGAGARHAGGVLATPGSRIHVVDDVAIAASSVGLALKCLVCRAKELVMLDELCFNQQIERFLRQHPGGCRSAWDGPQTV